MPSPFTAMASVMAPAQGGGFYGPLSFFFGLMSFGVGFVDRGVTDVRPMWHFTLGLYGLLTVVLFMLSSQLIKPVGRRRLGWRQGAIAVAILLLLGAVGSVLYPLDDLRELFTSPSTAGAQVAPAMPVAAPAMR
jgi:hypothetical protein